MTGLPELEKKCWNCWGTGIVHVENHTEMIECPECSGIGWIPTEDGQRLLDFLERHLTISSESEEENL